MNRTISVIIVLGFMVLFFAQADHSNAAEIKVWTARAIATVLAEIGPQFDARRANCRSCYQGTGYGAWGKHLKMRERAWGKLLALYKAAL